MMTRLTSIAKFKGDPDHIDGIDLWDCPCRECWTLDQAVISADGYHETFEEWVRNRTPETDEVEQ